MRALIAGCGYVGTALGLELAAAGHEVFGLRRDPAGLPVALGPIAADLTDRASLAALPRGIELVAITVAADAREPAAYRLAYVEAPATLLGVLADQGQPVRRVAFTSSTAVYGQTGGEEVDEESPTDPATPTGRILLEAERTVLTGPYPAVVIRLGGIYGPGRTRLLEQVRAGAATCPDVVSYTNRIHRDDCAGALHHLLTLDDPAPVYLGVDHDPAERCEVLRWLADRLGAPPPRVAAGPRRGGNKRARNDRLVASGYRFRYPSFRDGYAAMIAAEGSQPPGR